MVKTKKQRMFPPLLIPVELERRIEQIRKKLLLERPGENLSRANVVRMLLAAGCDRIESRVVKV